MPNRSVKACWLALGLAFAPEFACSEPFTSTEGSGGATAGAAGQAGGGNPQASGGRSASGGSKASGGAAANGGAGAGAGSKASGGADAGGTPDMGGEAGRSDSGGAGEEGGASGAAGAAGASSGKYPDAIRKAGPLVYWRMGIKSGRVVPDDSGHGNDLVLQGAGHGLASAGVPGSDDGAIRFDGEASFAIATDARALDFANNVPFTLEGWARRETGGGSYFQHLLSNTVGSPGARSGFMLYLLPEPGGQDAARSAFEYDSPGSETGLWGTLPAELAWGYYVAVFDGMNATLYVDGTLAETRKTQGAPAARSGTFSVGRASNGGLTFFKGSLDELAIYGRALTLAEVTLHYELGSLP